MTSETVQVCLLESRRYVRFSCLGNSHVDYDEIENLVIWLTETSSIRLYY